MKGACGMSSTVDSTREAGSASDPQTRSRSRRSAVPAGRVGRHPGLVVALVVLCLVGIDHGATTGSAPASNISTILALAAVIGVVSVGMTFVIIGGGIDLSVGAIVALARSGRPPQATHGSPRHHLVDHPAAAVARRTGCGLSTASLIAYGPIVPFIVTLAMLVAARGLAEVISDKRTQVVTDPSSRTSSTAPVLGIPARAGRSSLVAAARLGGAEPHHFRPAHLRGRRQPGGGPARRHRRQAADRRCCMC